MIALALCLSLAAVDAGPVVDGCAHVERGELDEARAAFEARLALDPDHELPGDASRECRGYFRLVKEGVTPSGSVAKPPPSSTTTAQPVEAPSRKPPNTLAIEDPDTLDYLWWTVAGVSAGAILVSVVLVTVAVAAPPAQPRGSLGQLELPASQGASGDW